MKPENTPGKLSSPPLTRRNVLIATAASSVAGLLSPHFATAGNSSSNEPSPSTELSNRGESTMTADQQAIHPFSINVQDEELNDLRRRILATRWPDREQVDDTTQGVQLATMQALARYWASDYDWRKVEARLKAIPQFH